ncbi:MAG: metal ABC transporter permease [Nitrospirota bacterium]
MFLIEPFYYAFMQKAAAASILSGLLCAVVGVYVILRRMALVGDALTHGAFPGMVLAYLAKSNLFLGAMIATLLTALGIAAFAKKQAVFEDTAVGVTVAAMFAFGVLLMSYTQSYRDLSSMLFGSILAVTFLDIVLLSFVTIIVIGTILLFEKELILFSFDSTYAQSIGISGNFLRHLMLILLALTVVSGIQVVGTVLTTALLVTPAAAARLLTKNFRQMMGIACFIGVSSCLGGVYLSYYAGVSSGAAIVLIATAFFAMAFVWKTARG